MTRLDWFKENRKGDIADLEIVCDRPVTDEDIMYFCCPDNREVPGAGDVGYWCKCDCIRCWNMEVAE